MCVIKGSEQSRCVSHQIFSPSPRTEGSRKYLCWREDLWTWPRPREIFPHPAVNLWTSPYSPGLYLLPFKESTVIKAKRSFLGSNPAGSHLRIKHRPWVRYSTNELRKSCNLMEFHFFLSPGNNRSSLRQKAASLRWHVDTLIQRREASPLSWWTKFSASREASCRCSRQMAPPSHRCVPAAGLSDLERTTELELLLSD